MTLWTSNKPYILSILSYMHVMYENIHKRVFCCAGHCNVGGHCKKVDGCPGHGEALRVLHGATHHVHPLTFIHLLTKHILSEDSNGRIAESLHLLHEPENLHSLLRAAFHWRSSGHHHLGGVGPGQPGAQVLHLAPGRESIANRSNSTTPI